MTEQRIVPASELARDLAEDRKPKCICRGEFVQDGVRYISRNAGCPVCNPLQSRYVTRGGSDLSAAAQRSVERMVGNMRGRG